MHYSVFRWLSHLFLFITVSTTLKASDFSRLAMDLSGLYSSNIGRVYDISGSGETYKWRVESVKEDGSIIKKGNTLKASWVDAKGVKGATEGVVTQVLTNGKADVIKWNNGVIFTRVNVSYVTNPSTCSGLESGTCFTTVSNNTTCYFACLADPCSGVCKSCISNTFTFGIDCHSCMFGGLCGGGGGGGPGSGGDGIRGTIVCEPCRPTHPRGVNGFQFCEFYKGNQLINVFRRACTGRTDN